MIIVKKSGFIQHKNFKFRCSLGSGGVHQKKREGDNITPVGILKLQRFISGQIELKISQHR